MKHAIKLGALIALFSAASPCVARTSSATATLLAETSDDIAKAYDLLDLLQERSEKLHSSLKATPKSLPTRLPRDIDTRRNETIKELFMDILSATPFSDPEKHLDQCKKAQEALAQYTTEIELYVHAQAQTKSARRRAERSAEPTPDLPTSQPEPVTPEASVAQTPAMPKPLPVEERKPEVTIENPKVVEPATVTTESPASVALQSATITPETPASKPAPMPEPLPVEARKPEAAAATPVITPAPEKAAADLPAKTLAQEAAPVLPTA